MTRTSFFLPQLNLSIFTVLLLTALSNPTCQAANVDVMKKLESQIDRVDFNSDAQTPKEVENEVKKLIEIIDGEFLKYDFETQFRYAQFFLDKQMEDLALKNKQIETLIKTAESEFKNYSIETLTQQLEQGLHLVSTDSPLSLPPNTLAVRILENIVAKNNLREQHPNAIARPANPNDKFEKEHPLRTRKIKYLGAVQQSIFQKIEPKIMRLARKLTERYISVSRTGTEYEKAKNLHIFYSCLEFILAKMPTTELYLSAAVAMQSITEMPQEAKTILLQHTLAVESNGDEGDFDKLASRFKNPSLGVLWTKIIREKDFYFHNEFSSLKRDDKENVEKKLMAGTFDRLSQRTDDLVNLFVKNPPKTEEAFRKERDGFFQILKEMLNLSISEWAKTNDAKTKIAFIYKKMHPFFDLCAQRIIEWHNANPNEETFRKNLYDLIKQCPSLIVVSDFLKIIMGKFPKELSVALTTDLKSSMKLAEKIQRSCSAGSLGNDLVGEIQKNHGDFVTIANILRADPLRKSYDSPQDPELIERFLSSVPKTDRQIRLDDDLQAAKSSKAEAALRTLKSTKPDTQIKFQAAIADIMENPEYTQNDIEYAIQSYETEFNTKGGISKLFNIFQNPQSVKNPYMLTPALFAKDRAKALAIGWAKTTKNSPRGYKNNAKQAAEGASVGRAFYNHFQSIVKHQTPEMVQDVLDVFSDANVISDTDFLDKKYAPLNAHVHLKEGWFRNELLNRSYDALLKNRNFLKLALTTTAVDTLRRTLAQSRGGESNTQIKKIILLAAQDPVVESPYFQESGGIWTKPSAVEREAFRAYTTLYFIEKPGKIIDYIQKRETIQSQNMDKFLKDFLQAAVGDSSVLGTKIVDFAKKIADCDVKTAEGYWGWKKVSEDSLQKIATIDRYKKSSNYDYYKSIYDVVSQYDTADKVKNERALSLQTRTKNLTPQAAIREIEQDPSVFPAYWKLISSTESHKKEFIEAFLEQARSHSQTSRQQGPAGLLVSKAMDDSAFLSELQDQTDIKFLCQSAKNAVTNGRNVDQDAEFLNHYKKCRNRYSEGVLTKIIGNHKDAPDALKAFHRAPQESFWEKSFGKLISKNSLADSEVDAALIETREAIKKSTADMKKASDARKNGPKDAKIDSLKHELEKLLEVWVSSIGKEKNPEGFIWDATETVMEKHITSLESTGNIVFTVQEFLNNPILVTGGKSISLMDLPFARSAKPEMRGMGQMALKALAPYTDLALCEEARIEYINTLLDEAFKASQSFWRSQKSDEVYVPYYNALIQITQNHSPEFMKKWMESILKNPEKSKVMHEVLECASTRFLADVISKAIPLKTMWAVIFDVPEWFDFFCESESLKKAITDFEKYFSDKKTFDGIESESEMKKTVSLLTWPQWYALRMRMSKNPDTLVFADKAARIEGLERNIPGKKYTDVTKTWDDVLEKTAKATKDNAGKRLSVSFSAATVDAPPTLNLRSAVESDAAATLPAPRPVSTDMMQARPPEQFQVQRAAMESSSARMTPPLAESPLSLVAAPVQAMAAETKPSENLGAVQPVETNRPSQTILHTEQNLPESLKKALSNRLDLMRFKASSASLDTKNVSQDVSQAGLSTPETQTVFPKTPPVVEVSSDDPVFVAVEKAGKTQDFQNIRKVIEAMAEETKKVQDDIQIYQNLSSELMGALTRYKEKLDKGGQATDQGALDLETLLQQGLRTSDTAIVAGISDQEEITLNTLAGHDTWSPLVKAIAEYDAIAIGPDAPQTARDWIHSRWLEPVLKQWNLARQARAEIKKSYQEDWTACKALVEEIKTATAVVPTQTQNTTPQDAPKENASMEEDVKKKVEPKKDGVRKNKPAKNSKKSPAKSSVRKPKVSAKPSNAKTAKGRSIPAKTAPAVNAAKAAGKKVQKKAPVSVPKKNDVKKKGNGVHPKKDVPLKKERQQNGGGATVSKMKHNEERQVTVKALKKSQAVQKKSPANGHRGKVTRTKAMDRGLKLKQMNRVVHD